MAKPKPSTSSSKSSERFLSVEVIAERLQASSRTVRRWIETGQLPHHKIGALVRINERDLAVFLAERKA